MDPQQLQQLGLTQDQIEAILRLGTLQGQSTDIQQQLEMARELQQAPGPRGRFAGRAYVKAHPMEHIAGAINRLRGSVERRRALERQKSNAAAQEQARAAYLAAFLRNRQLPQPTQTTATMTGRPGPTPGAAQTPAYRPAMAMPPSTWTPIRR